MTGPCSCERAYCNLLPLSFLGVTEGARTPRWTPSRFPTPGHSRDRASVLVYGHGPPNPLRPGAAVCSAPARQPPRSSRADEARGRADPGEGLPVPVSPLPAAAPGLRPGGLPVLQSVLRPVARRQRGLLQRNGAVTFNSTPDVFLRKPLRNALSHRLQRAWRDAGSRALQLPSQPPGGPPPPAGPVAAQ